MDNKNEKTFADIFSSSNDENNNKITFDNILNKTSENNKSFSDILSNNNNQEETEPNPFMEAVKEETTEQEEQIEENKTEELEPNPFIEAVKEETFEQEEQIEENKIEELESNPFMEAVKEETSEQEEQIEENKTEETEPNPFMEAVKEEKEEKEETTEQEEQTEENKIEVIDTNPFIETQNEEIKLDFNPFIGQEKEKSQEEPPIKIERKNELQSNDNSFSIEKEQVQEPKEEAKSTSPFFESDETNDKNNPFFERTLSLMENKNYKDNKSQMINADNSQHYHVKIVKKKEPLPKFIIGVLSYALFIWLLLIGITLLVYVLDIKIRAAKGDYSTPTYNAYVVLTGSMLPEIQVYDVVVTKKIEPQNLNKGDVITFSSADSRFLGTIITHRIINKTYDAENKTYTFQTKGDNNNVADNALVPQNNIYGKVILKIPKLGYLQEFLASRGGWIIVILIPCLTVLSYDIVKLAKGLKKKKYKNIKVQK